MSTIDKTLEKYEIKNKQWVISGYSDYVSFKNVIKFRDKTDDHLYQRIVLREWGDNFEVIREVVLKG
jgi:hypothetical protein